MDRENVIEALEHCRQLDFDMKKPTQDAIDDALILLKEQEDEIYALGVELASANELAEGYAELLKEQEAVKPEIEHSGSGVTWWNVCGHCKTAINPNDKFCHECGRPVLWIAGMMC